MAFQNRQVQYPNRRRLVVKEIQTDATGKITSLIVDVERNEGVVSVEGTTLSAENITAEIKQLISEQSSQSAQTAATQPIYDSSTKVATTKFVWDVLTALGHTKITNTSSTGGSSSSSGSSSSDWGS